MWCLTCHDAANRDVLRTSDATIAFENSYLVCGQCHAVELKDWYFGAHGKRLANWQGTREIYGCAHCHNPHDPRIYPRKPLPPPPVRVGLERRDGEDHRLEAIWERYFLEGSEYRP